MSKINLFFAICVFGVIFTVSADDAGMDSSTRLSVVKIIDHPKTEGMDVSFVLPGSFSEIMSADSDSFAWGSPLMGLIKIKIHKKKNMEYSDFLWQSVIKAENFDSQTAPFEKGKFISVGKVTTTQGQTFMVFVADEPFDDHPYSRHISFVSIIGKYAVSIHGYILSDKKSFTEQMFPVFKNAYINMVKTFSVLDKTTILENDPKLCGLKFKLQYPSCLPLASSKEHDTVIELGQIPAEIKLQVTKYPSAISREGAKEILAQTKTQSVPNYRTVSIKQTTVSKEPAQIRDTIQKISGANNDIYIRSKCCLILYREHLIDITLNCYGSAEDDSENLCQQYTPYFKEILNNSSIIDNKNEMDQEVYSSRIIDPIQLPKENAPIQPPPPVVSRYNIDPQSSTDAPLRSPYKIPPSPPYTAPPDDPPLTAAAPLFTYSNYDRYKSPYWSRYSRYGNGTTQNWGTDTVQPNAYGLGTGMNQYGQPVRYQVIGQPNADTSLLQVRPNAYGLGVGMDQFGRAVRVVPAR